MSKCLRFLMISILAILLPTMVSLLACKVTRVTKEEVDKRLAKALPIGSTLAQVTAFLDSLEVNGLRAHRYDYIAAKPVGTAQLPGRESEVQGYLLAAIDNSGRDSSKLQVYRIIMTFYFGKDERLIDYRTQMQGDW